MFIRIFKAESELEIWLRSGSRFVLLDTYPICHWSGTIGPKIHEGDKQTPEGFYEVTRQQLHLIGRHPRSLNLGFPNAFDKSMQRTGSYILVHGGCSSVGCFAMTNTVISEIYELSERALKSGQERINVHVFPFRMTLENMERHKTSEWLPFWSNLKEGYDAFEQTRLPPRIGLCEKRYLVQSVGPEEVAAQGPLAVCGETLAAISEWDRLSKPVRLRLSKLQHSRLAAPESEATDRLFPAPRAYSRPAQTLAARQQMLARQNKLPLQDRVIASPAVATLASPSVLPVPAQKPFPGRSSPGAVPPLEVQCDLGLASCRKWLELQKRVAAKALAFRDGQPAPGPRHKTASRAR